jgi:hypothetical protein
MQYFFNENDTANLSQYRSPNWDYARNGLLSNIEKARDFYSSQAIAVPSQHILVRMLDALGVNHSYNLDRFADIIDARALNMAMAFKMTSSVSIGTLFNGTFYGKGSKEILIGINDRFDVLEADKNWKNVRAVNVLLTTRTDLSTVLPDGKAYSFNDGISVVSINIPLLAVQYRAFLNNQFKSSYFQTGDALTTGHFVNMYVLPNMLYSQTDMILFNRLNSLLLGSPLQTNNYRPPFYQVDYTKNVDRYYLKLIDYFGKSQRDFRTILSILPMVGAQNFKEGLRLPDFASTRQIFWAEVLTRLDAVLMLTKLSPASGTLLNASDVNYFLREFNLLDQDNIFDTAPDAIKEEAHRKIIEIRLNTSKARQG